MLDEVCGYINNYFLAKPGGVHRGTYEISGSTFECDFLAEGQYFRVVNSVFNDGVYRYPALDMIDETFTGEVWAMKVPPAFMALVREISAWQAKYGGIDSPNMSPYSSESFNNYSYSKSLSGDSRTGAGSASWSDIFGKKITRWKKI